MSAGVCPGTSSARLDLPNLEDLVVLEEVAELRATRNEIALQVVELLERRLNLGDALDDGDAALAHSLY
jgi:hypothetical protein